MMTSVDKPKTAPRRGRRPAKGSKGVSIEVLMPEAVTYSAHELKLIKGTYQLIVRIGAQQLTLRQTARELNVSPGLLKYHFGDQERLLLETMRWALQDVVARIQHCLEGVTDPLEALTALIDEIYSTPKSFRELQLLSLDLTQYVARHPGFGELADLMNAQTAVYTAVIQSGVDAGVFHVENVETAVFQARALILGSGQQWIQRPDWSKSLDALRARCVDGIRALLGVARPPS